MLAARSVCTARPASTPVPSSRRPTASSRARSARSRACSPIPGARRAREWLPASRDLPCSWHHQSDEGLLVDLAAGLSSMGARERLARRAHASRGGASRGRVVAPAPTPADGPLAIVNPPSGATYLIDPTLRREFQTLPLRVVATTPARSNGRSPAASSGRHPQRRRSCGR